MIEYINRGTILLSVKLHTFLTCCPHLGDRAATVATYRNKSHPAELRSGWPFGALLFQVGLFPVVCVLVYRERNSSTEIL